jgi:D-arabinose 1-dehydrogenase-like Zn-dependent alcohol dehydrogenase
MRAILLENIGQLKAIQLEKPIQLGPNEALVKVHKIGICGTDIHAFKGRQPFFTYPRILGHELGVEVIEIGEKVTQVKSWGPLCCGTLFQQDHGSGCQTWKDQFVGKISLYLEFMKTGECVRYLRLMPNTCIPLPYCALNNWR